MAISSAAVVEVRLNGNDTNGGGWVTGSSASGGTDWSQQDTPQYSVTDAVTAGSTIITSATAGFGTDVVGNLAYVQGGGGAVSSAWYQIISRTNATTIVVDRVTGLTAGTSTTLKIGGALASPAQAANIATVAGQIVFIKYYSSASYTVTSSISNVPNGCVSGANTTVYSGYDTTRSVYNLNANRPTVKFSSALSGVNIFTNVNSVYYIQSLILDANNIATGRCAQMSGEYFYVKALNGVTAGLSQNSVTGRAILCEVSSCTAIPLNTNAANFCYVHDNSAGITSFTAANCISINNSGDGFTPATGASLVNCVAYNNSGAGFNIANNTGVGILNCIAEANSSAGYKLNTGSATLINCADFNNTAGRSVNAGNGKFITDLNPIVGTGSFFTSSTNFMLNNTAGAGAACRAAGFPSSWSSPAMSNFADVGALQSSNTGSGAATAIYGVMGS